MDPPSFGFQKNILYITPYFLLANFGLGQLHSLHCIYCIYTNIQILLICQVNIVNRNCRLWYRMKLGIRVSKVLGIAPILIVWTITHYLQRYFRKNCWLKLNLNLYLWEHKSPPLPVEASTHWERCDNLIQFKCTTYSFGKANSIKIS